jgi:iron complex transport system substrate-binding protein
MDLLLRPSTGIFLPMKKHLFITLFSLLAFSTCSVRDRSPRGTLSVTDDLGRAVSFDRVPTRVISLAPSLTEICFALDSGATLVGVTDYCDFPSGARRKQSVGGLILPNFELIAKLRPDLILATVEGNSREDVTKLESLGFRVFVTNPRTLTDIGTSILTIGKILDRDSSASLVATRLTETREFVRERLLGRQERKVFVIISVKPLMTAGPSTFIHQLIVEAGGMNIGQETSSPYPIFNREEVIRQQPDIIVATSDAAKDPAELLAEFPEWRALPAAKNRRVLIMDSDLITRPGPRYVDGLKILSSALHPEAFEGR